MDFSKMAKALQPLLCELRHGLHSIPEIGHDLPLTRAFVCKELDRLSIPYTLPECGGIVAHIGKSNGPKRILLRADMDALPLAEQTGLPFASKHANKMHACGHDTHMTMLLGAANILKQCEQEMDGEVVLCFQEAEEVMGGAASMIESGALSPLPERAFAFHIFPSDTLPTGTICCTAGNFMSSVDVIHVTVKGKSAHGSAPHSGINPILAAAALIQDFTNLMRYELEAIQPAVLTVCQINSGSAANIIPETCSFSGTLRMFNDKDRSYVKERLQQLVDAVELSYRVEAHISLEGVSMVYNDPAFTLAAHDWIAEMPAAKIQGVGNTLSMVSEDFCEFGKRVPAAMFQIISHSPEGKHCSLHNPCILFDDEVLHQGAAALSQVAWRYIHS